MKFLHFFIITVCSWTMSACVNNQIAQAEFTKNEPEVVARRDLARGRPQIYWGGTYGNGPLGIKNEQEQAIAERLSRRQLPTGCTVDVLASTIEFGERYNRIIIDHEIRKKKQF